MEQIQKSSKYTLKKSVEYSPGSIVSKVVTKMDTGNITLFAFDKNQELSEHTAPFDAMVQVLEGNTRITIGGEEFELTEGEFIVMPANVPHAVHATTKFKMMLVMIRGGGAS